MLVTCFARSSIDSCRCNNGKLAQVGRGSSGSGQGSNSSSSSGSGQGSNSSSTSGAPTCPNPAVTLHLPDPPYENYFYSDCNVDAQVVVTSPLPDSNLAVIGPRLVVAWPAGNSGACAFFQPQNGKNGTLGITLVNSTVGSPLGPVYSQNASSKYPSVGVDGVLRFNSSATMTVVILGSVRTIRDFTEGPSLLYPKLQVANVFSKLNGGGAGVTRLWLDNVTTTNLSFIPQGSGTVKIDTSTPNTTLTFEAGDYIFSAAFNYPQLKQLPPTEVLNQASQGLITQRPDQTSSLSFLSYTEKLLAGAWRFLTYFGRDSMIAALLLEPVLSTGNASAIEAVIGAVLERINATDGSVCHEETLGDYATWLNFQQNITSTEPQFDYKMIDSDYFLPILMANYFSAFPNRISPLFSRRAGSVDPKNVNYTYGDLALINGQKIMNTSAPFYRNQSMDNLIHLKEGQIVGQWRDSTYGIGGGRIPYDVNTALVPAALRAIATLSSLNASSSVYGTLSSNWSSLASSYAQTWEDKTLSFFSITVPLATAQSRLTAFANGTYQSYYTGPSHASSLDADVNFYGLALNGDKNLAIVDVMNTDDCFRLFLLNSTNDAQLTPFLNQSSLNVLRPFPAGLLTSVGAVVANPAFGAEQPLLATNFSNSAYHGTVVWSWQLAMLARGFERQLGRCNGPSTPSSSTRNTKSPAFCSDSVVFGNVKTAYNALWDVLEKNTQYLSNEVWSYVYRNGDFQFTPLGSLPPPPGIGGSTESNVRQLWSLTFLAVTRNQALK